MRLNAERGVEPVEVERVERDLVRVPLVTPTLPPATRTNTYLVDTGAGWLVVDIGPSDEAELVRLGEAIDGLLGGSKAVAGLVVTHEHPDHVGGLSWWRDRYGLPVWAHRHTVAALGGDVAWREVDGDTRVGAATLLLTPGHAHGHLSVLTGSQDLVAGDLVAGMGTIIVAPPDGDMTAYLGSLTRMASLHPRRVYPAHGPSDADGEGRLRAYAAHRLAREARVREALGVAPSTLMEVVSRAYADVSEVLWPMAAGSCEAHLRRLSELGEAVEDGVGWRLETSAGAP